MLETEHWKLESRYRVQENAKWDLPNRFRDFDPTTSRQTHNIYLGHDVLRLDISDSWPLSRIISTNTTPWSRN